jgi:hypothetical protein
LLISLLFKPTLSLSGLLSSAKAMALSQTKGRGGSNGAPHADRKSENDNAQQLRQHLERLTTDVDASKKEELAQLLRAYLAKIEGKGEGERSQQLLGDDEQVGTTVVVDTEGLQKPPISKSDPVCFADTTKGGFEVDDEEDEEEEEELTASTDDNGGGSEMASDKDVSSEEELFEDVEKEAEDKLSEQFLDYDKVWEYAMATPQGLLGQVKKGFLRPALIEVSNGFLLHARLSFKGGGQLHHDHGARLTAKEVLAAGPVRARVLFGVQEGWPFNVPLKKGHKKKVYHVAADSQQEAHVWLHTILEAPKDSTKSVRGFLWVESAQTGKWSRYYCMADPTHFEWFRTKEAKTYDLSTLHAKNMKLSSGSPSLDGSYTETSPVNTMKSIPKVSKKALRSHHMRELKNYKHELILWTKERPVKKIFHFMTESNDRRLFWKNVFVSAGKKAASDHRSSPATAPHDTLAVPSPSSSQPSSRSGSRPSSAYAATNPLSLSDPLSFASASTSSSSSIEQPGAAASGNPLTSAASIGAITFSDLPASSNPLQPTAAAAYMATRFSSLSEHMAFALKGVGEEEKRHEKAAHRDVASGAAANGAASDKDSPSATPPGSVPVTPEMRPRLSTISRDASIFRSGIGLETKETTQLRNDLRDLMEKADREAGKTSFGNYSLARSGVGDGHVRVIALDGGGLRAVMEAVILERLVEIFPDLLERTDMFAGISGGSMVAAGLVCGRSPTFIRKLLDILAPRVFNPKGRFRTGKAIQSSKFANKNLIVTGSEITKNIRLDQLHPKMLLIPSFLLDNGLNNEERSWEPLIFHNVPLRAKSRPGPSMPRSQTLSRELEITLQGSGNLVRTHKRSSSIDERRKEVPATSVSTPSLLAEVKDKQRKKDRKRGESFNNRAFTLRPPTSTAGAILSPREKVQHKRTRSSADDLAQMAGLKERSKESLLSSAA